MKDYHMSIRAYFPGLGNYCNHYVDMPLKDIKKWVEAYQFTHKNCEAITVKIYLKEVTPNATDEEQGRGSDLLQPGDQEGRD